MAGEFRVAVSCLGSMLLVCTLVLPGTNVRTCPLQRPRQAADVHVIAAQIQEWQSIGFTPAPATVSADVLAGPWSDVTLPHALAPRLLPRDVQSAPEPQSTAVTWYRLSLHGLTDVPAPRYLYIPRWKTHGVIAVYGDSRLLYQSRSKLVSIASNQPLWIPLDEGEAVGPPQTILIRIQHMRNVDGALSSVWVGNDAMLSWRYHAREWLQAQLPSMSSAAILAVGIFSFVVWTKRRRETLYLLCALLSAAGSLRFLPDHSGPDGVLISDAWLSWLIVNSRFWVVALTHFFLAQLHRRSQPWLSRTMIAMVAASGVLTVPWWSGMPAVAAIAPLMFMALLAIGSVAFGIGARNAWLSRSRDAVMLAGWALLGMLCGVHDWLLETNLIDIEGIFLSAYVNIGAFFIFMHVMFRRYVGAIDEVARVNAGLEQRLQARDSELAESYQRLREVEQRETLSQERRRMMQDMHDGVGATLMSALRMVELGQLTHAEIAEMLKGCVEDLKLVIDSMEPVEPDLLLLLATLRFRIGPRLQSMGIELRWEIQDIPALAWLDSQASLHILRILQEAFTNIIKHTASSQISVATVAQEGGVVVSILDNGAGFMLEPALQSGGRGLLNQMQRAESIGCKVRWATSEQGTCLLLWLPEKRKF